MKLNYDLQQRLKKESNADSLIELRYKGLDQVLKPIVKIIGIEKEARTKDIKKASIDSGSFSNPVRF